MEHYIIVNTENFSFLVKTKGEVSREAIMNGFSYNNFEDDTDEEIIERIFDDLGIEYEIMPTMIVNV